MNVTEIGDRFTLKKAYRENIQEQVRASMAFEGEHVSLKMLKKYLKSITPQLPITHCT
jgi:hypothetical protein